jgi:type I restriction enzyme R subunit
MKAGMSRIQIMQSKHFEHLRIRWLELVSLCGFAEQYAHADPEIAVVKLRAFAECCVVIVYQQAGLPRAPMSNFIELLSNEAFKFVTPTVVVDKLHAIRIHGNKAAHGDKVSDKSALGLVRDAWDLGRWLFATYANGDVAGLPGFEPPQPAASAKNQYKKKRQALLEQFAKEDQRQAVSRWFPGTELSIAAESSDDECSQHLSELGCRG